MPLFLIASRLVKSLNRYRIAALVGLAVAVPVWALIIIALVR